MLLHEKSLLCFIAMHTDGPSLQLPWLQTTIHYTGLDVENESHQICRTHIYLPTPDFICYAGVTGSGHIITCHAHATLMSGLKGVS